MKKLETPLSWILGIAFISYLFIANCECSKNTVCPLNNGFNFMNENQTDVSTNNIKVADKKDLNIDSIIDYVLEGARDSLSE